MRALATCGTLALAVALSPGAGRAEPPPTPAQAPAQVPPRGRSGATRDALERFLKGDFQGALQARALLSRFDFLEAERWIGGDGPATERRRFAASLFALEYAGLRPSLLPALLTWAREQMARQPPRPAEALWLRASIALAEGLDRWVFLVQGVRVALAPPPRGKAANVPPPPVVSHVAFARGRFPNDPYFRMAEAIGAEVSASRPLDRLSAPPAQSGMAWDRLTADMLDAGVPNLAERAAAIDRAAAIFEGLTSFAPLAAEAHLRLGYARLRQGNRDAALAHFDRVAALTPGGRLRYLAHFYSGWLLGGMERINEAVASYRAALGIVPRAQSASSLLIALLVRHDRLAEAEAAVDEFLAADPATDDPWRSYFLGDYPEYPRLVLALREELR
jgi:tetratricopeptide (TPR) repeat protein